MEVSKTKARTVRIVVMGDRMDEPAEADDEEEWTGESAVKAFAGDEEALQMRFVDSMHDGTTFGRVEAGMKYGKMD